MQVLSHVPPWVFIVFAALLLMGLQQTLPRRAGVRRVALLPVAMTALSFYGVASAFAAEPLALPAWAAGAFAAALAVLRRPAAAGTRFDAATHQFVIPGSFVPLALMMGIFATKFAVGMVFAIAPALAHGAGFAVAVSAVYGLFTGLFLGRALRLARLALAAPALEGAQA